MIVLSIITTSLIQENVFFFNLGVKGLTLNVKFLLQPQQKYYITQYEELGFSQLTQMKNDYMANSRYLTYTLSLTNVGRMYFLSLGVRGLNFVNW